MPSLSLPQAFQDPTAGGILALLLAVSLLVVIQRATGRGLDAGACLQYLWAFLLVFAAAAAGFPAVAVWILAGLSYLALREYFALAPLRVQDRWAMVGAYLAIPFMTWYIQTDWYGMFIISVPVYAFLVVPALVALGGREAEGTVLSIGAIDFGLFLFVFCAGHIGYLARLSAGWAVFLVLEVAVVDVATDLMGARLRRQEGPGGRSPWVAVPAAMLATVALAWILAPWAGLPSRHALTLGGLIPFLVWIGRATLGPIEEDLRVTRGRPAPGRGALLRGLRSFLFAGPVVFHYLRYFLT